MGVLNLKNIFGRENDLKTLKIIMSVLLFSVSIFMISNETAVASDFRAVRLN